MNHISFNSLSPNHFPLLYKWLKERHVSAWWDQGKTYTLKEIEHKYLPYVNHYKLDEGIKKPIHPFIIFIDGVPVGYIQYYNAFDFPGDGSLLNTVCEYPSLAALDFYIGESSYIGKGLGLEILKQFLRDHVFISFKACLVDPDNHNIVAIKTYEKAGFVCCKAINNCIVMIAKQI